MTAAPLIAVPETGPLRLEAEAMRLLYESQALRQAGSLAGPAAEITAECYRMMTPWVKTHQPFNREASIEAGRDAMAAIILRRMEPEVCSMVQRFTAIERLKMLRVWEDEIAGASEVARRREHGR